MPFVWAVVGKLNCGCRFQKSQTFSEAGSFPTGCYFLLMRSQVLEQKALRKQQPASQLVGLSSQRGIWPILRQQDRHLEAACSARVTSTPTRAVLQKPFWRGESAAHRSHQQAGHDEAASLSAHSGQAMPSRAGLPTEARSGRSATMPQPRGGER